MVGMSRDAAQERAPQSRIESCDRLSALALEVLGNGKHFELFLRAVYNVAEGYTIIAWLIWHLHSDLSLQISKFDRTGNVLPHI